MSKPDKPETEITDEGGFLSRWSRRKAEAREAPEQTAVPSAPIEEEAFDPASLPSIDDLTAESDFGAFLKKGVPPALRAAALRKLWLVEPSVVNYQPLVEYNWDFTAPGYGELLPTDDVAKFMKTVLEGTRPAPAEAVVENQGAEIAQPSEALSAPEEQSVAALEERPAVGPAPLPQPQPQPETQQQPRRRHGGALPS